MPSVTIGRPVTMDDVAIALQEQLGGEYEVAAHGDRLGRTAEGKEISDGDSHCPPGK
jgi:hypothetical protein